jgi:hypothetical protein
MIENAIEDSADVNSALENQATEPQAIIKETNEKLAALNLQSEVWVDSGIGRTKLGYAKVPACESPTKVTWELAFDIENLGRSVESLLTAPRVLQLAAIERLPDLFRACHEGGELDQVDQSCSVSSKTPSLDAGVVLQSHGRGGREDPTDVGKRRDPGADVSRRRTRHQG